MHKMKLTWIKTILVVIVSEITKLNPVLGIENKFHQANIRSICANESIKLP